ncbi:hypothetical protein F5878DRAFT_728345, partial [Lentinula raphanica]
MWEDVRRCRAMSGDVRLMCAMYKLNAGNLERNFASFSSSTMRFILASVHVLLGLFALSGARPTPPDESETKNSLEIPRSTESNSPTDVMK